MRCIFVFLFFCNLAQAEDIQTYVKEIALNTNNKQLVQQKAMNEVSRELIESLLGTEKFQDNKKKIINRIIKKQNHYILSVRSSPFVLNEDGNFLSKVTVKISKKNLKQLLLDYNLFYTSEASFCLLPMISFISYFSKKKESWAWWQENQSQNATLNKTSVLFFNHFSDKFIPQGFYPLHPVFQDMYEGTPPVFLPKNTSQIQDFIPLAKFYDCHIILSGFIQFGETDTQKNSYRFIDITSFFHSSKKLDKKKDVVEQPITFFFRVFNIKTQRLLFKIKKKDHVSSFKKNFEAEFKEHLEEVIDSLGYQLSFYKNKGVLDLQNLMMSLQGPLSYKEREKLEFVLIKNISALKDLKKRLLTSSRVIYEVESALSAKKLIHEIKKIKLKQFVVRVKGYKKNTIEIYVRKR